MPKQNLNRHHRTLPNEAQRFDFTVKTVKAFPILTEDDGEDFKVIGEFKVSHFGDAKDAADRLQQEFDTDCDPCRTYVYSTSPIPIYAGLARYASTGYRPS